MRIQGYASTNVGKIRSNNEDNYYLCGRYRSDVSSALCFDNYSCDASKHLFSVCDGMGGTSFGELASLIAVQTLDVYKDDFDDRIAEYTSEANRLICDEISTHGGKRIGTTFAVLSIFKGIARAYNIGDSRIYFMRDGKLTQLSVDHTQAQMMINHGLLTEEQAKNHRAKHILTQHLGIFPDEMLIEPGHMMPTEKPQSAHPTRDKSGNGDRDAVRYMRKHRIAETVMNFRRSSFAPNFP